MTRTNSLTEGNILKALFRLALPIMGTSFVQMAYNMTDLIWVGRLGSSAVASVGLPVSIPGWQWPLSLYLKLGQRWVLPSQWEKETWMRLGSISGIVFR